MKLPKVLIFKSHRIDQLSQEKNKKKQMLKMVHLQKKEEIRVKRKRAQMKRK